MGIILGTLAILLVAGLIASGVMYAKQQAIAQKEQQLRALRQNFDELQGLFDVIFQADSEPDIALALNKALIDLARQMRALDNKSPDAQALVTTLSSRETALSEGILTPKGQRLISSQGALNSLLSSYVTVLQKLQRFKIRGMIANHQYEDFSAHLKKLTLETEVESHLASAESLIASGDKLRAVNHFKHARDVLKKTNLEPENKNDRIREISDKIKLAESEEPASSTESPETKSP